MSDFKKCPTCHKYDFLSRHKCAPVWEARIFGDGDEWYDVHGWDVEDAAAKFAERYDEGGDYDIIRRGSAEIEVRKQGDATIIMVDISAESVPQYYARTRRVGPDIAPCDDAEFGVKP